MQAAFGGSVRKENFSYSSYLINDDSNLSVPGDHIQYSNDLAIPYVLNVTLIVQEQHTLTPDRI